VLSFIPPAAPMVVPARATQDGLPAGELIVSLVLMAVSVVALLGLAGRVYERTVLRLGAPIRLREALRLARSPARAHTAPR
jgi:ABC-2 type transport system permease protein